MTVQDLHLIIKLQELEELAGAEAIEALLNEKIAEYSALFDQITYEKIQTDAEKDLMSDWQKEHNNE